MHNSYFRNWCATRSYIKLQNAAWAKKRIPIEDKQKNLDDYRGREHLFERLVLWFDSKSTWVCFVCSVDGATMRSRIHKGMWMIVVICFIRIHVLYDCNCGVDLSLIISQSCYSMWDLYFVILCWSECRHFKTYTNLICTSFSESFLTTTVFVLIEKLQYRITHFVCSFYNDLFWSAFRCVCAHKLARIHSCAAQTPCAVQSVRAAIAKRNRS